jgi:hypothetical protein
MHLRPAQREVAGYLGDWRPSTGAADQLGEQNDVLGEQVSTRHSLL